MEKRIEARVFGRVQGVSFRYFIQQQADILALSGYTKNLSDGSVEVVAEGRRDYLLKLLLALERGPPLASVRDIEVNWHEPKGDFQGFKIDN
ncbi:MAG: acylphosphatase [Candidatus Diapherotrites archaeon CG11_big_fil_rev_8_21_14_0_20_37_9]|nr:MAG: acylphosphatase [Candidatus Diapherotrites archaeon CG11_big_fil_rev_8_21_14_0_20_37_9]